MKQVFQMLWTATRGGPRVVCALSGEKPEDLLFVKGLAEAGILKFHRGPSLSPRARRRGPPVRRVGAEEGERDPQRGARCTLKHAACDGLAQRPTQTQTNDGSTIEASKP